MKEISRHEAEKLFQASRVVSTDVEQDQHELRIKLTLENQQSFLVKYDAQARAKSYFLNAVQTV